MKALFFDLDGTLLTSSKTLLPSTVEALRLAHEKGVKLYIATGRSPHLGKTLLWDGDFLALFDGGIFCNGACIIHGDETTCFTIPQEAVRAILAETAQYPDVHVSLHAGDGTHALTYRLPDSALGAWGLEREEIAPLDDAATASCIKMLIFHDDLVNSTHPLPEELFPRIQERVGNAAALYLTDQGHTIQVAGKDSGKLQGIRLICGKLGLGMEDAAVFGDDLNDVAMLAACPNSVAMGNAVPEARSAARYSTLSCDEGGIAHALRHVLHIL